MNGGRNSNRIFTRHGGRARKIQREKAAREQFKKSPAHAAIVKESLRLMAKKLFRSFTRRAR
jgi:hypothetical protein